jgi:hypothetical protein
MKNITISTIIMATMAFSTNLVQAQDSEPKINRIQLKEQVREVVQSSANDDARFMKTERHQNRVSQDKQASEAAKKMEQHRYQYQQRKQYEQHTNSQYNSNRSSHYGQGYESRTRSMGASSSGGSSRQGGRR